MVPERRNPFERRAHRRRYDSRETEAVVSDLKKLTELMCGQPLNSPEYTLQTRIDHHKFMVADLEKLQELGWTTERLVREIFPK